MTDSFVTQCPHCQTSFRVTHHQLSVARGVVRCGQCLQVFNAAKQLLEQNRAATGESSAEAPPAVAQPVAPVAPAAEPVAETPAPDEDNWSVTAEELDALDLDQELARLERRSPGDRRGAAQSVLQARRDEQAGDGHGDELFGTATDDDLTPVQVREEAPVLIEQEPLDLEPAADDRTEPTLGSADLDLDDEPPVRHQTATDDLDEPLERLSVHDEPVPEKGLSALDDEVRSEPLSARDEEPDEQPGQRLEPSLAIKPERTRKEPLVDVVDDPLQLDWEKPAPNWGKRLLWGFLTLLAATLLAFQYVWFHFDEMARQDQYRPWFQQLCPVFGCQVPTRVDISRIKSSNLVVRSHPDFKGALIVDAIIYNRAPFAQPFPLLELRFADLNGQLIASRRFKPSEYLSGELAGRGEMPSQTPIHIALDILDPGPKAVNYSLSFRSPE
ncbi:hypothetical protein DA83_07310 [Pseudomonas sp. 250J]|uniref:DUF3426 domain-containing protein n=1 Tax=Pseudomonas peradeniyensis TaxID=2745488 RepID=A0ABT2VFT9_9PSED|nr:MULTISPECIES: DUF3426 domain-containing protein [Pseudomonas]KNX76475.1 hypothetical protein DA83_07310 [Pseudomonas sp. 250J]MCU7240488.1 DUF3426 domain-containing protein [Pseudomonas peradeniyensis]MCU7282048.1 DUF3426 domain-containing protein [Pseudomonas peradeniyensis]QZA53893.1 DUF3426 domain-containing protein [Pseudomonas sp. 2hn]